MACSILLKLACLVLVCMIVSAPMAKAEISCDQVKKNLQPCVGCLIFGGEASKECCSGIKTVYAQAPTQTDRQNICNCLKSAVNGISFSGFDLGKAAELPEKCGLKMPYKIDPSVPCNSVQ